MMKISRPDAPDWLEKNWETWGDEYVEKLNRLTRHTFSWKQHEGERVNHRLLPHLLEMTKKHCAFCDGFPMGNGVIKETIEHFCPKGRNQFPELAYHWENLFACCHYCQEKGDEFDENLLKPDLEDYDFHRYFTYNFKSGSIEVREDDGISQADKLRAKTTLKIYRINKFGRENVRKLVFRKFYDTPEEKRVSDDFSYRYMFL